MMKQKTLLFLFLGLIGTAFPQHALAQATPLPVTCDIEKEATLAIRITVHEERIPLHQLLSQISATAHRNLRVQGEDYREQRVTIDVTDCPLREVMLRICQLLSHRASAPYGFFWNKQVVSNAAPQESYTLIRTKQSRDEEREAQNYPAKKVAAMLREFRSISLALNTAKVLPKTELPKDLFESNMLPFRNALTEISETDLPGLLSGNPISLNTEKFKPGIDSFNRRWRENAEKSRSAILQNGGKDPYPGGIPERPPLPPALVIVPNDDNGTQPEDSALMRINLQGIDADPERGGSWSVVLDPFYEETATVGLPEKNGDQEPIIDLSPELDPKKTTPEQRSDISFTLSALARVAGIHLYEEHFYKAGFRGMLRRGLRGKSPDLPSLQVGTIPQLLNAICEEWGYKVIKIGEKDYLLWSRSWAIDRKKDVRESILKRYRVAYERNNAFTAQEYAEMSTRLSYPQAFLTWNIIFPKAHRCNALFYYECRLYGTMSEVERQVAMAEEGVVLSRLSAMAQRSAKDLLIVRYSACVPERAPTEVLEKIERTRPDAHMSMRLIPAVSEINFEFHARAGQELFEEN